MDNVYVLNYLVNRQLSRAKGKNGGLIRGPKSGVCYDGQRDTIEDDEGERNKGGVGEKMRRHVEGNKEQGEDRRGEE